MTRIQLMLVICSKIHILLNDALFAQMPGKFALSIQDASLYSCAPFHLAVRSQPHARYRFQQQGALEKEPQKTTSERRLEKSSAWIERATVGWASATHSCLGTGKCRNDLSVQAEKRVSTVPSYLAEAFFWMGGYFKGSDCYYLNFYGWIAGGKCACRQNTNSERQRKQSRTIINAVFPHSLAIYHVHPNGWQYLLFLRSTPGRSKGRC